MAYDRLEREVSKLNSWLVAAEGELRVAEVKRDHELKLLEEESSTELDLQKRVGQRDKEVIEQEKRLQILQTAIQQCETTINLYEEDVGKLEVRVADRDVEVREELSKLERESIEQAATFEAMVDEFEQLKGFKEWSAQRGSKEETELQLQEMEREIDSLNEELDKKKEKRGETNDLYEREKALTKQIEEEIIGIQAKIDATAKEMRYVEDLLQEKETLCRQGKAETYQSQSQFIPQNTGSNREREKIREVTVQKDANESLVSVSDAPLERVDSSNYNDEAQNLGERESVNSNHVDSENERERSMDIEEEHKERQVGDFEREASDHQRGGCSSPSKFQQTPFVEAANKTSCVHQRQYEQPINLQKSSEKTKASKRTVFDASSPQIGNEREPLNAQSPSIMRTDVRRVLVDQFEGNESVRRGNDSPAAARDTPFLSKIPRTPKTPKAVASCKQSFASMVRSAQQLLTPRTSKYSVSREGKPQNFDEKNASNRGGTTNFADSCLSASKSSRGQRKSNDDCSSQDEGGFLQEQWVGSKRPKVNRPEDLAAKKKAEVPNIGSNEEERSIASKNASDANQSVYSSPYRKCTKTTSKTGLKSAEKSIFKPFKATDSGPISANQVRFEAQRISHIQNRTGKTPNSRRVNKDDRSLVLEAKGDGGREKQRQEGTAQSVKFNCENQEWEAPIPFNQALPSDQRWVREESKREKIFFDYGPSEHASTQGGGPITQYFNIFDGEQEVQQEEYRSNSREEPFNINLGQSHTTQAFGFQGFNF